METLRTYCLSSFAFVVFSLTKVITASITFVRELLSDDEEEMPESHHRKRRSKFRFMPFFFVVSALILLWGEWLSYTAASMRWPSMEPAPSRDDAVRVLLVSDPQIQGYLGEHPRFGAITRWDSDRYLKKTFNMVFNHVRPHAVVFLGDLFDEGSIASHKHYDDYFKRFSDIFSKAKEEKTERIHIPGDNDVGGEGRDYKTQDNVMRFTAYFNNDGFATVRYVDFMHMNIDFRESYAGEKREELDSIGAMLKNHLRVGVNHHPMLARTGGNLLEAMQKHKIQLLFTGHDHTAAMFTCEGCHLRDVSKAIKPKVRSLDALDHWVEMKVDSGSMWEIMLPTCSYRMGERHMGYGVAVIKRDGGVLFTILWSTARFTQLYTYCLLLAALALYLIYVGVNSLRSHKHKTKRFSM